MGCVLVKEDRVIASGRRKNSSGEHANELDHAEVNTLKDLMKNKPQYNMKGVTAYSTMEPCLMCYTTLLLSGIRSFVWAYEDIMGGGTNIPLDQLNQLYAEMRVERIPDILRTESLALFQDFFRRYSYWGDSELARYTLRQNLER